MKTGSDGVLDLKSLERKTDALIKPRGKGVAFKMLRGIPEGLVSPPPGMALCQVIKAVSIYGHSLLLTKQYPQACADGEHVLGFRRHPEELRAQWSAIFGMSPELHDKLVSDITHLDFGEYGGALFAPMGKFDELKMVPDGVIFNVNSIQAELLILSTYLHGQNKTTWSYDGYAACEIVAAVANGRSPWIVFPCLGARSFCSTQDDEIWFGMSVDHLSGALSQLELNAMAYPPAVEQAPLSPPLKDHLISRLMSRPE